MFGEKPVPAQRDRSRPDHLPRVFRRENSKQVSVFKNMEPFIRPRIADCALMIPIGTFGRSFPFLNLLYQDRLDCPQRLAGVRVKIFSAFLAIRHRYIFSDIATVLEGPVSAFSSCFRVETAYAFEHTPSHIAKICSQVCSEKHGDAIL